MAKKHTYLEIYIQYGFTCQKKDDNDLLQCVICHKVLGNDSLKPAKLKLHLSKCHPTLVQKNKSYFERHLSFKRQRLDSFGTYHERTTNALRASYIVAYKVVQAKKPHTIVEQLLLPCAKEMVRLVVSEDAAWKLDDISVSNDTVSRHINEISLNIKEQVVDKIKKSHFAIQLDESTDVSQFSQLLAFVRYVHVGNFKEEFLFCKPLKLNTRAEDVLEAVNDFFNENGLDWGNLVGITTDGTPTMLGLRSGFQTLVKQHASLAIGVHCFIHREALASKTLPDQLNTVFKVLVKIVNYVKSSALNARLFWKICQDMESDFEVLLFHTPVRWLSAGKILNRIFTLKEELMEFLQCKEKYDFKNILAESELELAYLIDIFSILNKLNLQLQGKGVNLFTHQGIIKAFVEKLQLWINRVENNNFVQFPCVNGTVGDKQNIWVQVLEHLSKLEDEFQRYFPQVNTRDDLSFVGDLFTAEVHTVSLDFQEEILELKNDLSVKDLYKQSSSEKFWSGMLSAYPDVSSYVISRLLPFASTYSCECGFSSLLNIKSKQRNCLEAVESDLRCALSNTTPNIEKLVSNKRIQKSGSTSTVA